MRDHSQHIDLTREGAAELMLASTRSVLGSYIRKENVLINSAYGRVLAEDVCALSESPSCLTCRMDSVALRWEDFESLEPGAIPNTSNWERGVQWQFANTGIAMPDGFDTAIMIEHVDVSDDEQHIRLHKAPSEQYAGTRPAGSRLKNGDLLASTGEVITPYKAAVIASGNVGVVTVAAKPRVAFIPTGNELIAPGVPAVDPKTGKFAAYGKTFETNSVLVRGLVEEWGGEYVPFDIVLDNRDQIAAAIKKACSIADIVVINAGSSKGSDDWSCEVMEELGEMHFHQIMHGPGRHTSFAIIDDKPVLGISGPPAGAALTLPLYLNPLIRLYQGIDPTPVTVSARLATDLASLSPKAKANKGPNWSSRDGFKRLTPVKLFNDEYGTLQAEVFKDMSDPRAVDSNAIYLMVRDEETQIPSIGDVIEVELR